MTTDFWVALTAVIGLVLLGMAWKWRQVPISLAAAVPWLALGIGFVTDAIPGLSIADPMVTVMAFACLLLIYVALMPSIMKSTQVTQTGRKGETFVSWMKPPRESVEPRGRKIYRERREKLKEIVNRSRR